MSRGNPLFVDSTKFHGDGIEVQIELTGALIFDDEELSVVIHDIRGEQEKIRLDLTPEGSYQGRSWLKHQQEIDYFFVVEKSGQRLLRSGVTRSKAGYMILARWEPELLNEIKSPAPQKSSILNPSYEPQFRELIRQFDLL